MGKTKFTLIELLVVLAILGILTSLLLPSLSKAREKGRRAVCLSNLKQISIGSNLYSIAEDNKLPVNVVSGNHLYWGHDKVGLERALAVFVDAELPTQLHRATGSDIYMCPSSPVTYNKTEQKYKWITGSNQGSTKNTYEGLYYHYRHSDIYNLQANPVEGLLNRSSYVDPSRHPYQWCSKRQAPVWTELDSSGWNNLLAASSWHGKDNNPPRPTVFMDGHAKILKSVKYTRHGGQDIMQSGGPSSLLSHTISEY